MFIPNNGIIYMPTWNIWQRKFKQPSSNDQVQSRSFRDGNLKLAFDDLYLTLSPLVKNHNLSSVTFTSLREKSPFAGSSDGFCLKMEPMEVPGLGDTSVPAIGLSPGSRKSCLQWVALCLTLWLHRLMDLDAEALALHRVFTLLIPVHMISCGLNIS